MDYQTTDHLDLQLPQRQKHSPERVNPSSTASNSTSCLCITHLDTDLPSICSNSLWGLQRGLPLVFDLVMQQFRIGTATSKQHLFIKIIVRESEGGQSLPWLPPVP